MSGLPFSIFANATSLPSLAAAVVGAARDSSLFSLFTGHPPEGWVSVALSVTLAAAVFIPFVLLLAMFAIWWERKAAGHIQSRIGPTRLRPLPFFPSLPPRLQPLLTQPLIPHH